MGPRRFSRGRPQGCCPWCAHHRASMGPRRFSRGREAQQRASNQTVRRNGATAFQPWKGGMARAARPTSISFNGATAFQPWKGRPTSARAKLPFGPLQWGHGVSAVEGTAYSARAKLPFGPLQGPRRFSRGREFLAHPILKGISASMGPRRLAGRRFSGDRRKSSAASFNGATAFQPWKGQPSNTKPPGELTLQWATAFQPWKVACSPLLLA